MKLQIILLNFVLLTTVQGQQCDSNQFVVRNGGVDFLTITSPTDVKTCGGVNICSEIIAAKQTLSLTYEGSLSISNGNSVQIPDASSTNEIQTLELDGGGQLSISNGNSVILPDNSATNEIQTLAINQGMISLSKGGGSVDIPDTSATNEIQSLSIDNNDLSISEGNTVSLPNWRVWSYRKIFNYTVAIQITTTTWTVVQPYELILNFPRSFSLVQITLLIPFCGNSAPTKRGRAQLYFDGSVLADFTTYGPGAYMLFPLHLYGMVHDVTAGNHVIQVRALADSGNVFLLPAYDPALGEGIHPAIFGSYNIIGFP